MSGINDGFGEGLTDADIRRLLVRKEPLLQIMASERDVDPADWQDAVQEARIKLWRVLQKHPDATDAYLHRSAARRISEVRDRQTWFGHTRHHGQPTDPLRQSRKVSLDDPLVALEATAPDLLDSILLRYHDGEIVRAIAELSEQQQEYVVLRFWGGLTTVEIAARQHKSVQNTERVWREVIRPALNERLQHLQER